MTDWVTIPTYPEYAISEKGLILHIATGKTVETYMGRTKLGEPLHPRVRLKSNGIPMPPMAVKDLMRATFKTKKKVKKSSTPSTRRPSPQYEPGPAKEYRRLPEFPKYEIAADGTLRNWWTKKKLTKFQNKRTGAYSYGLHTEKGTSTHRNPDKLVWSAWPELAPPPVVKEVRSRRKYSTRGEWCDIDEFDGRYQVHPDGHVRYTKSRRRLEVWEVNGECYVTFYSGSGRGVVDYERKISELVDRYCGRPE